MFSNTRTVRIEWGDCDPAGIIFYPRYFAIFDASTSTLLEQGLGMSKKEFLKAYEFGGIPVVKTRAQFFKPTSFGDYLQITSTIRFGTSSFSVEHEITKDGEIAVKGSETRVWVKRDPDDPLKIKAHPIPPAVIEKFAQV
jgi:4-hydroxybenzoyl-CoA thioesterase